MIYPHGRSRFTLWNPDSHPTPEQTSIEVEVSETLGIRFSGRKQPHILRICLKDKPQRVLLDGRELPEGTSWEFKPELEKLIVKTPEYSEGHYEIGWSAANRNALD